MAYADVATLARLLKVDATGRADDLERVLEAAKLEIDHFLGREIEGDFSGDAQDLALVQEVNLERAVEHWQQGYSPFAVIGLGSETGGVFTPQESFKRHAMKLAPLKVEFGLA